MEEVSQKMKGKKEIKIGVQDILRINPQLTQLYALLQKETIAMLPKMSSTEFIKV